jgi:iron(III) transport system ATP-binding protein
MLSVDAVGARFGDTEVLRNISFALAEGQIAALLGPSGSGKTTLLRILAGFEFPSAGSVTFGDEVIATPQKILPPEHRGFAMVFQDHALLPHLSVAGNVGFGLHKLARTERAGRINEALDMVGLAGMSTRKPHELSGGQQQRV